MLRRRFVRALANALLLRAFVDPLAAVARTAGGIVTKKLAVGSDIDGIVIRGAWRARVALGDPSVTVSGTAAAVRSVTLVRSGTTLTIESSALGREPLPEVRATVARLRGLATSGSVVLTLEDSSTRPLFLDLAGSGLVRAAGSVPLLRVTTSGSVVADLTELTAQRARVHARQKSVLKVLAFETLTIVAVDRARVFYAGTARPRLTLRGGAKAARL